MQCLVVDDSKSARFTLKRALSNLGHEVITAESGEQALELLCAEEPDIIFMDHLMPGLDGFETSKKIRSQKNFAQTPIVMCTAKDSESYAEEARKIGLSGTLPKPATEPQIKTIFETVFNRSPTGIQSDHVSPPVEEPIPPVKTVQPTKPVPKTPFEPEPTPVSPAPVPTPLPRRAIADEIHLNDQLRALIRAEAEGRARDAAQKLLSESWSRFRGSIQEDARQQTIDTFNSHIKSSMDKITHEVYSAINRDLSIELRKTLEKRITSTEIQTQTAINEIIAKLNGLKRQVEIQKFDPVALQETILEDARKSAEYTATHKAVDTASKIARELCEETINEIFDKSIAETYQRRINELSHELNLQNERSRTLTMITSFASVLSVLSFTAAVWALM